MMEMMELNVGQTLINVAEQVKLPFDTDWFAPAPGPELNSPLPKMGVLHPSHMPLVHAALMHIKSFK